MKIMIINQEPLVVSPEEGKYIIAALQQKADHVIVRGEYVRSSAISGIRNDETGATLEKSLWGALPAGQMKSFFDERREPVGNGYKKFQDMKRRMLSR